MVCLFLRGVGGGGDVVVMNAAKHYREVVKGIIGYSCYSITVKFRSRVWSSKM